MLVGDHVKHVPPSGYEAAFDCPHCGALSTQIGELKVAVAEYR